MAPVPSPVQAPPPRGRLRAAASAAIAATGAALLGACVGSSDRVMAPGASGGGGTVRASLQARLAVDAPPGAEIRLLPAYQRVGGAVVPLAPVRQALGTGAQEQLTLSVELAPCLADPLRTGPEGGAPVPGECWLTLRFLLVLDDLAVDSATVGPLAMRGGGSVVPGTITLREVTALRMRTAEGEVLTPTAGLVVVAGAQRRVVGEALDGQGRVRPGRSVTWSVAPPAMATVSDSGMVRGLSPGSGTIGARAGAVELVVPLRVLRPPAQLRVEPVAGSTGRVVVTSEPAGIACTLDAGVASGPCAASFPGDTTVTLRAAPQGLDEFRGWGGDCAGDGACALPMDRPRVAVAGTRARFPLSVRGAGGGSGLVTSTPPGIRCAITDGTAEASGCQLVLPIGDEVRLEAQAGAEQDFTGWSGACTGTGACVVRMTEPREVVASIAPRQQLVVTGAGTGTGTVVSTPNGIACRIVAGTAAATGCAARFPRGAAVSLAVTADAGHDFFFWGGACAGSGGCTVTLADTRTVSATMQARQPLLVEGAGTGDGTVRAPAVPGGTLACDIQAGVASGGTCALSVRYGTLVALQAAAGATSDFGGWEADCAGSGSCAVTMTAPRTVRTRFTAWPTLTIDGSGTGGGTVTSTPAGIACAIVRGVATGAGCASRFPLGTEVLLGFAPSNGMVFQGWSGDCAGLAPCRVVLSQSRRVSAAVSGRAFLLIEGAPGGLGSVLSNPAGLIACTIQGGETSGTCEADVLVGDEVVLEAVPLVNFQIRFRFRQWGGACSGTAPVCRLTIAGDSRVTAVFEYQFGGIREPATAPPAPMPSKPPR